MNPRGVGRGPRITALLAIACASSCVRDDWRYDAGAAEAAVDAAPDVATDAGADAVADAVAEVGIDVVEDRPTLVDTGAADTGPIDVATTDRGTTDSGGPCPAAMVMIPAGQFLMGDATGVEPLALPVHGVRLSAFCLDVAEVTVAAYRDCVGAACTAPSTLASCNWGVTGRDDHPINCVTREQALAYCAWRGATLPTEAQWEYAARRDDTRVYPWGTTAPSAQLCWSGGGTVQPSTCATRSFPAGESPFGLFDMAGGVSEMTADWYAAYSGNTSSYVDDPTGPPSGAVRVRRGGSWRSTGANDVRVSSRESVDSPFSTEVGFRCARAVP